MKAETMMKIENLKNAIAGKKMTYDMLSELVAKNDNFPSMTTLRKYNLLVVVEEEETEYTTTEDDYWDNTEYYEDYMYDADRDLYVCKEVVRYYGIKD